MNNWIHSITNWNSRAIGLVVYGLMILGDFINHWNYFICVIAIISVISFIRYFHDRKWLKNAEKYIRIRDNQALWKQIVVYVIIIGSIIALIELDVHLEDYLSGKTLIAFAIINVFLIFQDHFQKFVDSVKSFEEGIQLPGRNQELIPWKEIYTFTFENKLFISSSKGEYEFLIHTEDPEHANGMISDWKERNGKRN